jgi:23S rRNA (cytidine1920-2'-O)/16S rRNA (cytidine1409-2'-O)-methyltransferase
MKERLDKLVVDRGLARSRERARALVMEGLVLVDGSPMTKAGTLVKPDAEITLKGGGIPYVSRGGLKIEAAARHFGVDFTGKVAMDVGASTGGFTDFMLQSGAAKVYCIDVGYGQLDMKLRRDPRVVVFDKTNIRYLERSAVPDTIDIAAIDVSFISLEKVVPKVAEFLAPQGEVLALIKPQFEAGRSEVGKGGIVRDEAARLRAVESVKAKLEALGLETVGVVESPVRGQKGNVEYFIYLRRRLWKRLQG